MGMHGFYVLEVKTEALSSVQSMSSTPPKFIHLDITPPKKKPTSIFSFLGDNTQISIKDMHALSRSVWTELEGTRAQPNL